MAEAYVEGEAELYFPAGQARHDVAFVPEKDPDMQGVHLLAPPSLEYVRAGQTRHCDPSSPSVYEATNPEYVLDEPDVNRTYMYPVDAVTGPGTVEPLNGLPGSSVVDEHDDDWHEYTRT